MEKEIENAIKNSVGYFEASNKKEFMSGANVGVHNASKFYEQKIAVLESQLVICMEAHERCEGDLKTLATIINRYSDSQ